MISSVGLFIPELSPERNLSQAWCVCLESQKGAALKIIMTLTFSCPSAKDVALVQRVVPFFSSDYLVHWKVKRTQLFFYHGVMKILLA